MHVIGTIEVLRRVTEYIKEVYVGQVNNYLNVI